MHVWLPPADGGLGDRAWECVRLVFTEQSESVKGSKLSRSTSIKDQSQSGLTPPCHHHMAGHQFHSQVLSLPPPPPLRLSRLLLLPSTHESAVSAKILLPSALVEACLLVCLTHKHRHLLAHCFAHVHTQYTHIHTHAVPHISLSLSFVSSISFSFPLLLVSLCDLPFPLPA